MFTAHSDSLPIPRLPGSRAAVPTVIATLPVFEDSAVDGPDRGRVLHLPLPAVADVGDSCQDLVVGIFADSQGVNADTGITNLDAQWTAAFSLMEALGGKLRRHDSTPSASAFNALVNRKCQ